MIKEGKSAVSVAGSTKMYSTSENMIMHLITWLAHVFFIKCYIEEFVRHLWSQCCNMQIQS